jgi:hypothetical protein
MGLRGLKHGVGLAHTRKRAKKYFKFSATLPIDFLQKSFGRRPVFRFRHKRNRLSSAPFSALYPVWAGLSQFAPPRRKIGYHTDFKCKFVKVRCVAGAACEALSARADGFEF